jgi:hypothetical protein
MVDPDTFLTTLYVMVDDLLYAMPPMVHPGPMPALSVSEVVTLALFGQWRHFAGESAFYRWARRQLQGAFPTLPHRSQYNRLLRRCQRAVIAVGQALSHLLDAPTCAYEVVDSLGVTTRNVKRRGNGWLDGQAAKGWCTRLGWFHGFQLLVAVTPQGAVTGYGLTQTTTSEQARADTFLALRQAPQAMLPEVGTSSCHVYLVDMGFAGQAWWKRWRDYYGAQVIYPPRSCEAQTRHWPARLRQHHAARRQIIETVNQCLLLTFGLEHERPHTLAGLRARLAAKVALHNFCLWFNSQLGRPPLAFADLIAW